MKTRITLRQRVMSIVIAAVIMLSFTTQTVMAATDIDLEKLPDDVSITYNTSTGEITYGEDQNYVSSDLPLDEMDLPMPTGIVGTDGRKKISNTTDSPYRNICYVKATFADGYSVQGSGTLVYFNVLLTAGHLVYKKDHRGWAKTVQVYPGKNGNSNPLGSATSTKITSNNAWINNENHEYDWAIVDLNKKFNTWQLYGYYKNYNAMLGEKVDAIGFNGTTMYKDTNSIRGIGDRYMHILCDTAGGSSGGAVIDTKSKNLVGIISYEHKENGKITYNGAVRINQDLYNKLKAHQSEVSK